MKHTTIPTQLVDQEANPKLSVCICWLCGGSGIMPCEEDLDDRCRKLLAIYRKIQSREFSRASHMCSRSDLIEHKIDAGTATVYEITDWLEFVGKGNAHMIRAAILLRSQYANLRSDYAEYLSDHTRDRSLDDIRAAISLLEE